MARKNSLSFNQKRLTKETQGKIIILLFLFVLSFAVSVVFLNFSTQTSKNLVKYERSLPTVYVNSRDQRLATLYGNLAPLKLGKLKTGIVPVDSDRTISLNIDGDSRDIDTITCDISSRDGSIKVASYDVEDYSYESGKIHADLKLSNLVDPGNEYILTILLNDGKRDIYYYTILSYPKNCYEFECLEFARDFKRRALSSEYESLALYMEPAADQSNKNLSNVSITSPLNDVGWIGYEKVNATEAEAEFIEITPNYTSLYLRYQVTIEEAGKNTEYDVEEYYRMRRGEERIYLLDYRRAMFQKLKENSLTIQDGKLLIGQTSEEIEYKKNQTGANIAFVWNKALYEYNSIESTLKKVADYESYGSKDIDIHIRQIDENGNIDYIVIGYMPIGEHEGYSGIGLFHHESEENYTAEQAFMQLDLPYEAIKSGFNDDIYLIRQENVYLSIEDTLVSANLSDGSVTELMNKAEGGSFALSYPGQYMAYSTPNAGQVMIRDLASQKQFSIDAPEGKYIRVIDFIGDDLVYGIISQNFGEEDYLQNNIYPYEKILIENITNSGHETVKEYAIPGKYITNITKQNQASFLLTLSEQRDYGFEEVDRDSIQSTGAITDNPVDILRMKDGRKSIVYIKLSESGSKKKKISYKGFSNRNISYYQDKNLVYKQESEADRYYAYFGTDCVYSSMYLSDCIKKAYETQGYCLNNKGICIWQYGRGGQSNAIDFEKVNKDNPLKLKGISLEMALSFIYKGNPVIIDETLAIIGYDSRTVTVYNIQTKEKERLPQDEKASALISHATSLMALMQY